MTGSYDVREWFREDIIHEDPEQVAAWHDWFQRHGIDPVNVLLTHWVERRAAPIRPAIIWLEYGERDGERITVHHERDLALDPEPFPVP